MADQESTSPIPVLSDEAIAKDGDLTLVVGAGEHVIKLQVYSQCLKAASKVFKAMLTPPWKESQDLANGKDPKVLLPDDDPLAMREICRIIHHQKMPDSDKPPPERLLQMAIVADKYDFCHALSPYVSVQLSSIMPETSAQRMYCFAAMRLVGTRAQNWSWIFDLVGKQIGPFGGFLNNNLIGMTVKFKDLSKCWIPVMLSTRSLLTARADHLEQVLMRLRLELTQYLVKPSCGHTCYASSDVSLHANIDALVEEYSGSNIMDCAAVEVMEKLKALYGESQLDAVYIPALGNIALSDFSPYEAPQYTECECGYDLYRGMDTLYRSTISDFLIRMA